MTTEIKSYTCGLDGQGKDYTVISFYKNGKLIKEKIIPENKNKTET